MRTCSKRAAAALLLAVALAATATPAAAARASAPASGAAAALTTAAGDDGERPWFCHELDCPDFKLEKNLTALGGIELRAYPAAAWVSTRVEGKSYDGAVAAGFWKLFKYISGNNQWGAKVAMAAPVTVRVDAGAGPACKDAFTVSFFLPFDHQQNPPAPSDEAVFIERREALRVYVASFGGFARGATWLERARGAAEALQGAGIEVEGGFFYTAGYDSPFRVTGRHNEVWLPAAGQAAAADAAKAACGRAAAAVAAS